MADHVRQQIRERIATTVSGLSTTGSRVYQSRIYPLATADLPGLLIYSISEDSEIDMMGSGMNRNLSISIEGYVRSVTELDDKIDDICKEVEVAMAGDVTLNNLAKNSFLGNTNISYSADGDQPIGVVTLTYLVQYRTASDAPDVAL